MRRGRVGVAVLLLAALLLVAAWLRSDDGPRGGQREAGPDGGAAAVDAPATQADTARRARAAAGGDDATASGDAPRDAAPRVVDVDGRPVAGALVEVVPVPERCPTVEWVWDFVPGAATFTTESRADGTFDLPLPSGREFLRVTKEGFAVAAVLREELSEEVRRLEALARVRQADEDDIRKEREQSETIVLRPPVVRTIVVLGPDEQPVAGAEVIVTEAPGSWDGDGDGTSVPIAIVRTGGDGRAAVAIPNGGAVVVRAAGFALDHEVFGSQAKEVVTLHLPRGTSVAGRVVDSGGTALAAVRVHANRDGSSDHASVWTSADGTFRFERIEARWEKAVELVARAPGFVDARLDVRPGECDVVLVARRPASVSGVVLAADGSPVAGATVETAWPTSSSAFATTDAAGAFRLEGLATGRTVVSACTIDDDGATVRGDRAVADLAEGAEVSELRFVLRETRGASVVAARVESPDGVAVEGAEVTAWFRGRFVGQATTDAEGRVTIDADVSPGTTVDLAAEFRARRGSDDEGAAHASAPVPADGAVFAQAAATTVAPGRDPAAPAARLRLGPRPVVHLRAVDEAGNPVEPRASTLAIGIDGPSDVRWTGSTAVVEVGISSKAAFVVKGPRGRANREFTLVPPHPPEREVTVVLPRAATIRGRILRADGTPTVLATDVRLRVTVDDTEHHDEDAYTAPDGRFEATGFPPGTLHVWFWQQRVQLPGRAVAAGETIDLGDLVVDGLRTLRGLVVDASGHPVGGAAIGAFAGDFAPLDPGDGTGPDGLFAVPAQDGASSHVVASRRGFGTTFVAVGPRDDHVTVRLVPECAVVLRLPGVPSWSGYTLRDAAGRSWTAEREMRRDDPDGTCEVRLLRVPPGRLDVWVEFDALPATGWRRSALHAGFEASPERETVVTPTAR